MSEPQSFTSIRHSFDETTAGEVAAVPSENKVTVDADIV